MEYIIIDGVCIEVLERLEHYEYIIRDSNGSVKYLKESVKYLKEPKYEEYSLHELVEEYESEMSKHWRDKSLKRYMNNRYKEIIELMRKYSRNELIDELLDEKEKSITGLNPLVFAC